MKYPIENYSQEFTLNSESIFIDSKKIRESPVLALARNVITPKGVRIKNLKINGSCNLKSKICKFKDIRLGKRNLIISGSGYYNSGKSIGYFNFLIRFPKLPKLKLHMNISIKNSDVITKVEKIIPT